MKTLKSIIPDETIRAIEYQLRQYNQTTIERAKVRLDLQMYTYLRMELGNSRVFQHAKEMYEGGKIE